MVPRRALYVLGGTGHALWGVAQPGHLRAWRGVMQQIKVKSSSFARHRTMGLDHQLAEVILPIADQLRLLNIGGADARRNYHRDLFALSAGTRKLLLSNYDSMSDAAPVAEGRTSA